MSEDNVNNDNEAVDIVDEDPTEATQVASEEVTETKEEFVTRIKAEVVAGLDVDKIREELQAELIADMRTQIKDDLEKEKNAIESRVKLELKNKVNRNQDQKKMWIEATKVGNKREMREPIEVILNGHFYTFPPSTSVHVPEGVYGILCDAQSTVWEIDGEIGGQDTIKEVKTPAFFLKEVSPPKDFVDAKSKMTDELNEDIEGIGI